MTSSVALFHSNTRIFFLHARKKEARGGKKNPEAFNPFARETQQENCFTLPPPPQTERRLLVYVLIILCLRERGR